MLTIGLMSGTSADGVDAALVDFTEDGQARLIATAFVPYHAELKNQIHELCEHPGQPAERITEIDQSLVHQFAQAVETLIDSSGIDRDLIQAIGSHGQTIDHQPGAPEPYSRQIGNAAHLARSTGIKSIGNFRTADIRAGGQGAPLAPALHNACFRSSEESRVILNIGGIANITVLSAHDHDPVLGFDTGPGNTLLDYWTRQNLGQDYDVEGRWASSGKINEQLLAVMLSEPYFSQIPPKSTGRELFNPGWLTTKLDSVNPTPAPMDVQATLLELTAKTICQAIDRFANDTEAVYVCGGGSHNLLLMQRLDQLLTGRRVATTAQLGIDPDWVEAVTFAWLAWQTLSGRPGNLPSVTGANQAVVLGEIFESQ